MFSWCGKVVRNLTNSEDGREKAYSLTSHHEFAVTNSQLRTKREIAMKTITSALVALLVIAGAAGTANAFDAKIFYEQVDWNHN